MTSPFHFRYGKAAQAVASLLRREPHKRMNYYRLLKLLYIADRQSVIETGRPIIGGRLIAMKRGPLHSATLDLMQGKDTAAVEWAKYFRTDHYEVEMVADPGNGDLSKREIGLLNRVRDEHEREDEWQVGEFTHHFSEFLQHQPTGDRSVNTIPFSDLLAAVGRSQDAAAIEQDAREKAIFDRTFGA